MKKLVSMSVFLIACLSFAKTQDSRKPNQEQEQQYSCKISLNDGKTYTKFKDINKDCDTPSACFSRQLINIDGYFANYDIDRGVEHVVRVLKNNKIVAIAQTYVRPVASLAIADKVIVQCD